MRREWLGFALVVVSALSFGSTPSIARLALEAGANAETVALVRCGTAAVFSLALLAATTLRLPRLTAGDAAVYLAVAACLATQSFAYPASVLRIPVSTAVVIFFLFPAVVGVVGWLVLHERLTGVRAGGLALGFAGVALTVGAAPQALDPVGVALALTAAVTTGLAIVYGAKLRRRSGILDFTVLTQAAACGFVLVGLTGLGEVRLPAGTVGWTALALSGGLFTIGMFAFFGALSLMAAVRAATVANLEPLWAIFVAMMLFGEAFAGLQWLGAALVIGAVLIGPLFDRSRG